MLENFHYLCINNKIHKMIVKCSQCGQDCEKEPRRVNAAIKNGLNLYCSRKCVADSKKKSIKCNCAHCGKEVEKTPSQLKKSISGNVFCDKSCAASFNNTKHRSGENNPNWKGGFGNSTSHNKKAYRTYEEECAICGFKEFSALEVHHIDEDRSNGDINNLIILCSNHHSMVHYGNLLITDEIKKAIKHKDGSSNLSI